MPKKLSIQKQFAAMVLALVKPPEQIVLTKKQIALMHASIGIAGEAGELVDAFKKYAVYGQPLDRENVIEELGDLEFYLQDFRNITGITREETLAANIKKLSKRYAGFKYTDKRAKDRADKKIVRK